jgi:Ubiquitin-2 like Rad60 SUMO-like
LPFCSKGFVNAPQSVQDFKLIHGGQALENDKALKEYLNSPAAFSSITTIHVVMKPPSGIKLFRKFLLRIITVAYEVGMVLT